MQPGMGEQPDLFRLLVESVRITRSSCWTPTATFGAGTRAPSGSRGTQASEIIGKHFSIFYPASEIRRGKPDYELRVAIEVGRYEEKGGASGATVRASGRVSSSRRCATAMVSWSASRRSRAT